MDPRDRPTKVIPDVGKCSNCEYYGEKAHFMICEHPDLEPSGRHIVTWRSGHKTPSPGMCPLGPQEELCS